jgi:3-oxoacyl-[acyl-carrier protein] reductase
MDLGLKGRVALVTAASRGLGLSCATAFAQEGASVVITARGKDDLAAAEQSISATGANVLAIASDMDDPATPRDLVAATIERFGRIDVVLASNAGPPRANALDVSDEDILAAVNSNMLSTVRLVREALPHMREASWGRICAIASYSIVQAMPQIALSNAARSALWAWAKTAAHDLEHSGVTINVICPGPHMTPHLASRPNAAQITVPLGDVDDFGKIVAFLCSEPAAYINGARIVVDGGKSLSL